MSFLAAGTISMTLTNQEFGSQAFDILIRAYQQLGRIEFIDFTSSSFKGKDAQFATNGVPIDWVMV
ncbi:hypothetical protein N7530_000590 [Penicillium desertorum]|uniref:Uncharacterized protein n=1 Tax=Penicillium desertorum TaxID=1303715 RepID=A0A9W9X8E7_9EURO|nr:hypothetical protein N7530_000590 [Penicillium desertorum]